MTGNFSASPYSSGGLTVENAITGFTAFKFYNNSTTSLTAKDFLTIKAINGKYYADDGEKDDHEFPLTIGNTYKSTFAIKDTTNFEFVDENGSVNSSSEVELFIKYQTAKIGSTYYTIEDAIAQGGNIVLVGSTSGYIMTSFTKLQNVGGNYNNGRNYEVKSGTNLFVPHNDNITFKGSDAKDVTYTLGSTSHGVYSVLAIPTDVTITVNGAFAVGGAMAEGGVASGRGVVMNEGSIIVNTAIYCYGYIKSATGNGFVELKSGAKLMDVFRVYDWRGGTNTMTLNEGILPFNAFSFHNLSCKTIIHSGSTYQAMFYESLSVVGDVTEPVTFLGAGGMFNLTSGYAIKTTENALNNKTSTALTDIIGSNQIKGQKDKLTICGVVNDSSITIEKGLFGYGINIVTGKNYPLSVPYIDIIVGGEDGTPGTLNLTAVSYNFLPGTSLVVNKNGTLNVGAGVNLYMYTKEKAEEDFYTNYTYTQSSAQSKNFNTWAHIIDRFDSYLLVNGTANIAGSLGGKVRTNGANATITLTNNTATTQYVKTLSYDDSSWSPGTSQLPATGNIIDRGEDVQFGTGLTYRSNGS
ncbi:MAG: hypothetical protein IJC01_01025, partial [Clostridia bacterium]|nr:hypothetical protein [Clostridia bacterium]